MAVELSKAWWQEELRDYIRNLQEEAEGTLRIVWVF